MGDMQVGDEVIAYDGTISKVTVYFRKVKKRFLTWCLVMI